MQRCAADLCQYDVTDSPFKQLPPLLLVLFSKTAGAEPHKRLCRVCFDLPADGEGQPELAEQKGLCTSSRRPGNSTHLPSIIPETAASVARPNALYAI